MRILWVKVGGLTPANTGGRLRSVHILAELARAHHVTVLTTHSPEDGDHAIEDRLARCARVISLPYKAPKYGSMRFPLTVLRSWFSALPVDLYKYQVPAIRERLIRLIEDDGFDVCIADFLSAMPNVPMNGSVPVVFFAHNVEHRIWRRLCESASSAWQKPFLEVEWRKMRRYERKVCGKADVTVAVSPEDRDVLGTSAVNGESVAISTGVDVGYFRPEGPVESPSELVFTGSMDWRPNEDAILYFIEQVLPMIRCQVPDAALTVVGRNPSARLQRVADEADVRVTGTVDDIRPYVARAAVYVVPLRVGGGTRLKILEALAMGKAVVSTTIGAEGLPLRDGEHFVCADDPADFAGAVVALLGDPERRRNVGDAGRALVENHHSWTLVGEEFAAICRKLVDRRMEGGLGQ